MAKNLANLVEDFVAARRTRDTAEETLQSHVKTFTEAPETVALKTAVTESDEELEKARFALIEEMQKQKMQTFDGEKGKATLSRKVTVDWEDDDKVIEFLEQNPDPEMKKFVATVKKIDGKTKLKAALREKLEIDGEDALKDVGVHLEEVTTITVTARDNEQAS